MEASDVDAPDRGEIAGEPGLQWGRIFVWFMVASVVGLIVFDLYPQLTRSARMRQLATLVKPGDNWAAVAPDIERAGYMIQGSAGTGHAVIFQHKRHSFLVVLPLVILDRMGMREYADKVMSAIRPAFLTMDTSDTVTGIDLP